MRRKWVVFPIALSVAAAAAYGVAVLLARPAPGHPFFATDGPATQAIAHRGGAGLRPENTLAAFSHAVELGTDMLEMDVRSTADGAIVCIHDATLERTTDGQGRVDSLRLGELQQLDAGYHWSGDGGRTHPFRGKGIRVPALAEVFDRFPGTRMNVEIKPPDPAFAELLCALIRRSAMTQRVLVASMHEGALRGFRGACPEVATSLGPREARIFIYASRLGLGAVSSPPGAALQIPYWVGDSVLATPDLVAAARRRNLKLHVWTVNDEERMRQLSAIGVDGIITDRPDLLARRLPRARP